MLQRLFENFQVKAGSVVRLSSLAVAVAASMFVATGFLAAAAFIFVLQKEGAIVACFAGGAVFLVVAAMAAIAYAVMKNRDRQRLEQAAREAAQSAKSAASTIFSDPATLAIGLQLVRVIGVKRMIPLLAIGGIALGFLINQRSHGNVPPAE